MPDQPAENLPRLLLQPDSSPGLGQISGFSVEFENTESEEALRAWGGHEPTVVEAGSR
jgi:hypothetical protein